MGGKRGRRRDGTWVRHHDDDALGAVADDLRDDVFEDVGVPLHQVQPALALLLTDAGGHHHHAGVCRHRVVWVEKEGSKLHNRPPQGARKRSIFPREGAAVGIERKDSSAFE